MENAALLILLESVLGKSQRSSKGNYAFVCPFHTSNPPGKKNMEINAITNEKNENPWHCWGCGAKGKTAKSLLKQLKVGTDKFTELNYVITPGKASPLVINNIELPEEFISLIDTSNLDRLTQIEAKHALKFIRKRNLTTNDIIKYNIGFCKDGKYSHRIIIPSYDCYGKLNYFMARDYTDQQPQKYKNPPIDSKSAIGFELYINWDAPIILIEGIFDALTVKRNVIPIFGKIIHEKLMKKLVQSSVNKIYIALDPDAIKNSLKYAQELMTYNKEIYLVELDGKDASEVGINKFLETIEKCQPLTFQSLINKKINII